MIGYIMLRIGTVSIRALSYDRIYINCPYIYPELIVTLIVLNLAYIL